MRRSHALLPVLAACLACASGGARPEASPRMTVDALKAVLHEVDANARGADPSLDFEFAGVRITAVWDEGNDRMRLVAPVRRTAALSPEQVAAVFQANFHSALDARYGTSQGILYAAFLHPLGALSRDELLSAVHQVASLVLTFGTTYSSGALVYRDPGEAL